MLANGVSWFDDWFAVAEAAPGIFAIGEPRFHQVNWNYLVLGQKAALLFDTGPGVRDIAPVVASLTTLPLAVLPSHMHFDHTGNLHRFDSIALADLPMLRACVEGDVLHASEDLFLGSWEGMTWKPCRISTWVAPGSSMDLGGRQLKLLHTPGHAPDHVSLWDAEARILLAADFIYPGALYAQVPGADLASYLASAEQLRKLVPLGSAVFSAHGKPDSEGLHTFPRMSWQDIADLETALKNLRKIGGTPTEWPVNGNMRLLLGVGAFAAWQNPDKTI